jgi:hypothetical protein
MLNQFGCDQDKKAMPISGLNICLPEDPAYPAEFLNAIQDTAFQALQDLLNEIDAPKEAVGLVEDLAILAAWTNESERGGKVGPVANYVLIDTVANAVRNIAAIGGAFYSPSGTTIRRGIAQQPPISDQESGE